MNDDQNVRDWTAILNLGNALFKDLRVGEAFHWKGSDTVNRKKTKDGWYIVEDGTGRRYKTGIRTACFRYI